MCGPVRIVSFVRPPRHRRRWTAKDDDLLEDLLGVVSTRVVAIRLGRTVPAVWSRASYLGISPYSGDGRYTASEIARLLAIPVNTVLLWCQRGYLPARKVGRKGRGGMGRIDWDGRGQLELRTPRVGSTMRFVKERQLLVVIRAA